MTAHIKAKKGDFSKVVLMPGDPLRAKWIAENFLENPKQINDVRGMLAYTGTYKGKIISIMGHGMGCPSIGIYSYELFKFYDVDCIIRIGSAGSYVKEINLGDVIIAEKAFSESTYGELVGVKVSNHTLVGDKKLNGLIMEVAKKNKINLIPATVHSSDVFYGKRSLSETIKATKSSVVEMEAFALFANAQVLKKSAACLLTCSDSLVTHEQMSAEDRQNTFKNMVTLALECANEYLKK